MKAEESVIDYPKESLCPEIWQKVMSSDGSSSEWTLTDVARLKLEKVALYLWDCIKDTEGYDGGIGAHITGSITSNQYTENADVDLHLYWRSDRPFTGDAEQLNKAVRAHFEENFKDESLDDAYIGKHPIEVYFQGNVFQDMMSVGCYDLFQSKWIVGPEIADTSYSPYAELYRDVKEKSANIVKGLRSKILNVYEKAVVMLKVSHHESSGDVTQSAYEDMVNALKSAAMAYQHARAVRKHYSEPHSAEEAKKFRMSKDWKIADASFKLLDKFGYLAILKDFTTMVQSLDISVAEVVAEQILSCVKKYISNDEKLADSEPLDESSIDTDNMLYFHGTDNTSQMFKLSPPSPEKIFFVTADLDYAQQYGNSIYVVTLDSKKINVFDFDKESATDVLCQKNKLWPYFLIDKMEFSDRHNDVLNTLVDFGIDYRIFKKHNFDLDETYEEVSQYSSSSDSPYYDLSEKLDAIKFMLNRGREFKEAFESPDSHTIGVKLRSLLCKDLVALGYNAFRTEELKNGSMTRDAYGIFDVSALGSLYPVPLDADVVDEALEALTSKDRDLYTITKADRDYDTSNSVIKQFVSAYKEKLEESESFNESLNEGKAKLWIDDVRPAPDGYVEIKSVSQFIDWIDVHGTDEVQVIDIDHDAGDYQKDGGDYIKCLDYLEHLGAHGLNVRIHSANPVGVENMRRIIKKNGWKEVFTTFNEDGVVESAKSFFSLAAVIGMLAIPGILPKEALGAELQDIPLQKMTVNSPQVKAAISKATNGKSYNGMNCTNIVNAVARTIYAEAKSEGKEGQAAVASVIWNRANGKAENLVPVISKKLQFSCWNKYTGGWKDSDYKFSIPSSVFRDGESKATWDNCMALAVQLVNEEFTSTIGNRNSYMNKDKAEKKNVNTWGKKLDLKIGKHHFGYLPNNDGAKTKLTKTPNQKMHVVKKGDTLQKIAKDYGTTAAELAKNNNIKDPNKIAVGQKLKV